MIKNENLKNKTLINSCRPEFHKFHAGNLAHNNSTIPGNSRWIGTKENNKNKKLMIVMKTRKVD